MQTGRHLYVVADDEHHLGVLQADGEQPVQLVRLLPSDLPQDKEQRKRRKPDLEALALLPPHAAWPHGALLALGSGSRPQRCRAVLLLLDAHGAIAGEPRVLDVAALYAPLRERFGDLNIEGAFASGTGLHLLQRANQGAAVNACIAYPLADIVQWIAQGGALPPATITPFELGTVQGVPYGFTDGAALPGGGWIFSAVAEDTPDSYADGRCAGSALGTVNADGTLLSLEPLPGAHKVEGIALLPDGRLLMVTDADDPGQASALLEWRAQAASDSISAGISAGSSRAR
nr:hypothetical protein [Ramlibacter montanisoli]